MLRRSLVVAVLAVALVPATALSATVHIRVEGRTRTLFGAAEPRASGANALDALESASVAGELYYHVTQTSFGPYVDQIGRYGATASSGWVFKVNGVSPPVGADKVELKDGDRVLWYYADFGPTGGPPTLDLTRTANGCYRVVKVDDAGHAGAAAGSVLRIDGRTVKTQGATAAAVACPGPHRGLVRATLAGAVRSNAVA